MNCTDCGYSMEEFDPQSFNCEHCWKDINLCVICNMVMENQNSDICGHASCVEKKAEAMFK